MISGNVNQSEQRILYFIPLFNYKTVIKKVI